MDIQGLGAEIQTGLGFVANPGLRISIGVVPNQELNGQAVTAHMLESARNHCAGIVQKEAGRVFREVQAVSVGAPPDAVLKDTKPKGRTH